MFINCENNTAILCILVLSQHCIKLLTSSLFNNNIVTIVIIIHNTNTRI